MAKFPYAPVAQWIERPPPNGLPEIAADLESSDVGSDPSLIDSADRSRLLPSNPEMESRVLGAGSIPVAPTTDGQQVASNECPQEDNPFGDRFYDDAYHNVRNHPDLASANRKLSFHELRVMLTCFRDAFYHRRWPGPPPQPEGGEQP